MKRLLPGGHLEFVMRRLARGGCLYFPARASSGYRCVTRRSQRGPPSDSHGFADLTVIV